MKIFPQTSLKLEIFSRCKIFFSIIGHEQYFFQCRIFFSQDLFACFFSLEISPQEIFSEITHNPLKTSCHSTLIFIGFAIASISSGSPFLKSCVTLLYSNVLAGQSPTLSTIKPIKIMPSEYCTRIMHESYACGLKTSISRIKDNFSRLTHKSGQIVLNT